MPLSWLIALACIALAWRRFSALKLLRPPPPSSLIDELARELGPASPLAEDARRFLIAELNHRIGDVSFALGLLPSTLTALIRICLASGSALALISLMELGSAPIERAMRAGVCAVSGLVGAGVVSAVGRAAKQRAAEIRLEWDRTSREAGKALQTSLK